MSIIQHTRMVELTDVWHDIKKHARLYCVIVPISFIIAIIYAEGQKNMYGCRMVLSPEIDRGQRRSIFTMLNSHIIVADGYKQRDPINFSVYPDLIKSVEFKSLILSSQVQPASLDSSVTYLYYLRNCQKNPWWDDVISWMLGDEKVKNNKKINVYRPSVNDFSLLQSLNGRIKCKVDKVTMLVTIQVIDQDPKVCIQLSLMARSLLQDMVNDYKTKKLKDQLKYEKEISDQRKKQYEIKKNKYVKFADGNKDAVSQKIQSILDSYENEMNMAFLSYTDAEKRVLDSERELQEQKPSFFTLQSPTLPIRNEYPDRVRIVVFLLMYTIYAVTCYVLYKEKYWRRNLNFKITFLR